MANEETVRDFKLEDFLSSVDIDAGEVANVESLLAKDSLALAEASDQKRTVSRFVTSLAAVLFNLEKAEPTIAAPPEEMTGPQFDKQKIANLTKAIDDMIADQVNQVLHDPRFQHIEATWTAIDDLCYHTDFSKNIQISLLDITKDEAGEDLELNFADIAGSEIFKKVYVAEYDQYGGKPYGAMIGLYDFSASRSDIKWLRGMGKVAKNSHAPFVTAVNHQFFGCSSWDKVNQLRDLETLLNTPKYSAWNELRESDEGVYIGLTMPRYMLRAPYDPENNPAEDIDFTESMFDGADAGPSASRYLWGNSSMLFARNLVKAFAGSGWCQSIRGIKGGGLVSGLPCHVFNVRGENEVRSPVEISMPDFREYELASCGLIPLIQKKESADAVFFSAQSVKKSKKYKDPKDSENSQLVTNLSYTMSVSRIAHYLKCIMRDNIGSTAHAQYIYNQIDRWISGYCTSLVNPDDLTLRYYPFKTYSLEVSEVVGKVGWYHCNLSILPHIQFEGMDVDLRVDARLG